MQLLPGQSAEWWAYHKAPVSYRKEEPRKPSHWHGKVLACTDPTATASQVIQWYEVRWQVEVCQADYDEKDNLYRGGRWAYSSHTCLIEAGPLVPAMQALRFRRRLMRYVREDVAPPGPARANQRVLLKELWAALPPTKQQEVLRTLSRLVTQGLEASARRKEVRDEQHL